MYAPNPLHACTKSITNINENEGADEKTSRLFCYALRLNAKVFEFKLVSIKLFIYFCRWNSLTTNDYIVCKIGIAGEAETGTLLLVVQRGLYQEYIR